MKKALSLLLFVFIAVGMSMPAFAGDLKMSNGFEVRMFNGDRGDFYTDTDGSQTHVTHLLSSAGSYSSEPGFSINWNVEAMNGGWGYSISEEDNELNFKALYAMWDAERFAVSAGYLDVFWGNGWVLQGDGFGGFLVDLKATKNTTITLMAGLNSENNDYDEDDATDAELLSDSDDTEDGWIYGVQLTQMFEGGKANLYYLGANDEDQAAGVASAGLQMIGAAGMLDYKGINFSGEAATSFGDNDGTDYSGTFFNLNASTSISEAASVEARLYYALGVDGDDESASYNFMKRGAVQPLQQGLGAILDHDDGNLQLMQKAPFNIWDLNGQGDGLIGMGLSGAYKVDMKTTLNAGIIYAMPELDGDDAGWDNLLKLNASVIYAVSKSLTLGLGASYMTAENNEDSDNASGWEDDAYGATAIMAWSF
ncbi:hypothetical protein OAH46_02875 [Verrucomicrobia bacterium]|nr:hypothetical protein [Verrucomicrobiota bacterium]